MSAVACEGFFTTGDGCRLAFEEVGTGPVVLWQHGLGASRSQPAEVFPAGSPWRRITLECRGHGASDLGDPERLSMAQFAEDAVALLDHLGIERAVVGGISLGAAIGLRLAAFHPDRVRGLILARPAWLDGPSPDTQAAYREVADVIRTHGVTEGVSRFELSHNLARIEREAPDNAVSLRGFFTRPRPQTTVELLSRIPLSWPGVTQAAMAAMDVPTRVIGNDLDDAHPLAYARQLAAWIPGAQLRQITSKSTDRAAYVGEFRQALAEFLNQVQPA